MSISGEYNFKIWKEGDYFLAQDEKRGMITQGRDENEIFEMMADAYLTIHDIPVSKWDIFWHRLLRLK